MFPFALTLSYDGTLYFGWQKTQSGPSVQETLERAILQIAREAAVPEAASRTDRGVHAEGQSAAFSLQNEWEPLRLLRALNAVLPPDIRVVKCASALPEFHPTLHAKGKEYHYRLCLGPVQEPRRRHFSWHFHRPLDLGLMQRAAQGLLGKRDFSAFANGPEENPFCSLSAIEFAPLERQRLQIAFRADRFLYKMARNLAGTLVYVGCGKLPPGSIPAILESKDRRRAGPTAPARGLFLHRVDY